MKLRWFRTHDSCDNEGEWKLQFWNETIEGWTDIPYVECHEKDEAKFTARPPKEEDYF